MSSIRSRYDFTEPTRRSLLDQTRELFESREVPEPGRSAEWLLREAAGCSGAQLRAYGEKELGASAIDRLMEMVERRVAGEPVQYILGRSEFYGLELEVGPAVLVPRPETERVVDRCLELVDERLSGRGAAPPQREARPPAVLDVGTGSGCIALAIASERPGIDVRATDVSEEALALARRNAERLELPVSFFRADLESDSFVRRARRSARSGAAEDDASGAEPGTSGDLEPEGSGSGYDLLVANPPYVPDSERSELEEQVRGYEPGLALFTGEDPLVFYRLIVRHAAGLLGPGGWLVFETHAGFGNRVRTLLEEAGYAEVELRRDWSDRPRVVSGRRTEEVSEAGGPDP